MSDEVAIVNEFEKDRVRLRDEQDKAVKEESVLVAQLEAADVERKATIAHLDAKRKELLRTLKEERQSVLSELKKRRRKLLGRIQSARNRQQRAVDKIEHLRGVRDLHLARLKSSSKLKRKAHEDNSDDSGDDQEDDDQSDDQEDEEDEEDEEEEDPELEEWKRLSDAFKNHNKDIEIGTDRRKAVSRAFHELEELKVVAPPPYNENGAPQSEVKTLDQLLAAIRNDDVARVYQYGPNLLNTSVVEELAARNDSTHDGVLRLPGVRALIAALTSPDCSWRTLKLLTQWAKASGPNSDIYDVREMERYWVAGFKGLAWTNTSSSSSSSSSSIPSIVQEFLPQSYVPRNRMDKKIIRDWELDVLVPIIDIDSNAEPDSNASSEESMLCKVYQAPIPDANLRRLVNQASKLFEVCKGGLVSGVYHRVLATDERLEGWDLEERRGRLGRKKVQLNDTESDAARRVVRACWRLE